MTAAVWPARRLTGVDFVVTEQRLPLWIKSLDFVDRDVNLRRAARAIVAGIDGDEARTLAVFRWTLENIRPQPRELRVYDDHVWYVIVRGYGAPDQQADVFTTLLTYAGVPAYWQLVGRPPRELPVSYVRVDGTWRVFDVAHGIVFRTAAGTLATPADLEADSSLVLRAMEGHVSDTAEYIAYFEGYQVPAPPDVLRADLQMTWRRLAFEARKLVGRQGRVWEIRSTRR